MYNEADPFCGAGAAYSTWVLAVELKRDELAQVTTAMDWFCPPDTQCDDDPAVDRVRSHRHSFSFRIHGM